MKKFTTNFGMDPKAPKAPKAQGKKYNRRDIIDNLQHIVEVMHLGLVGNPLSPNQSAIFVLINDFIIPRLNKLIEGLEIQEEG